MLSLAPLLNTRLRRVHQDVATTASTGVNDLKGIGTGLVMFCPSHTDEMKQFLTQIGQTRPRSQTEWSPDDTNSADRLTRQLRRYANAQAVQAAQGKGESMAGDQGIVAQLERVARRYQIWAWVNVGIAVVGALLTFSSYGAAAPGSRYVVFGGAIVGGVLFAIINTVRYFRTMNLLIRVAEAPENSHKPASANPVSGPAPDAAQPAERKLQVFNPPPGWPRMPEGGGPDPAGNLTHPGRRHPSGGGSWSSLTF